MTEAFTDLGQIFNSPLERSQNVYSIMLSCFIEAALEKKKKKERERERERKQFLKIEEGGCFYHLHIAEFNNEIQLQIVLHSTPLQHIIYTKIVQAPQETAKSAYFFRYTA